MKRALYYIGFLFLAVGTFYTLWSLATTPEMKVSIAELKAQTKKYYYPGTIEVFRREIGKNIVGICGRVDLRARLAAPSSETSSLEFERRFKSQMTYSPLSSGRDLRSNILYKIEKAI
jgi:hypothetical protein